MSKQLLSMPNRIMVIQDYAGLWQQFFSFFAEPLEGREFTPEEEEEFSKVVSLLALNHYKFQELTKAHFPDAGKVMDVLCEAVSLEHLREVPPASLSKFQVDWHTLFIGMNKALGKMLKEMSPKDLQRLQAMKQEGQQLQQEPEATPPAA